jgi:nitrogen fixation protein FixH
MMATSVRQITGRHVLAICLGFFGVMLAANMAFVFFALSTFNGGEGGKAYQVGLDYNQTIAAARAQEQRGWSHRIEAATAGRITVLLTGRDGAPVTGLAVSGDIGRPAADRFTRPLTFQETRPGAYAAETGALNDGNWVVNLAARAKPETETIVYRAKERLWLKPNS